ncbi:MAG: hypothetical protein P1V81_18755 [Planctomycetota bacterium]|nr:hypothetical protein [Planctomycetota bacterium]
MSTPINQLCCQTLSMVFGFCIGDPELERLGLLGPASPRGAAVRLRALSYLRQACHKQLAVARNVSDLLDLEYAGTVLLVRDLDEHGASRIVELWSASPCGQALPGLVWALCTDPRPGVVRAGQQLAVAASWLGQRRLVEDQAHAARSGPRTAA